MEIMNNLPPKLDLEETELRLGLPAGGGGKETSQNANGKRGFEETILLDLKLNLSSNNNLMEASGIDSSQMMGNVIITNENKGNPSISVDQLIKPPAKAQVVGWPPVKNFRKNILTVDQKKNTTMEEGGGGVGSTLVKVSIDGAPYLRKVDLKMYKSYQQLSDALGKMFNSFTMTTGNYEAKGMIDFMNENKLIDLLNNSDYVPTYEDKDGDWMLVGDVPWGMFVESCKRVRIMKGTEAAGLAPRAMEKCKNRS